MSADDRFVPPYRARAPKIDASPPLQRQCQSGRREGGRHGSRPRPGPALLPDLSPTATSVCQTSFAKRHCYEQFYPAWKTSWPDSVRRRRDRPMTDDNTWLMSSCTYHVINDRHTSCRPASGKYPLSNRSAVICRLSPDTASLILSRQFCRTRFSRQRAPDALTALGDASASNDRSPLLLQTVKCICTRFRGFPDFNVYPSSHGNGNCFRVSRGGAKNIEKT